MNEPVVFTEFRPGKFTMENTHGEDLSGEWWSRWESFMACVSNARSRNLKGALASAEILQRFEHIVARYYDEGPVLASALGAQRVVDVDPKSIDPRECYILEKFGLDVLRVFWNGYDRVITCSPPNSTITLIFAQNDDDYSTHLF